MPAPRPQTRANVAPNAPAAVAAANTASSPGPGPFDRDLTVMAIAEEADGRLLFGTFGGGIAAYDGRDFQLYTTEHGKRM